MLLDRSNYPAPAAFGQLHSNGTIRFLWASILRRIFLQVLPRHRCFVFAEVDTAIADLHAYGESTAEGVLDRLFCALGRAGPDLPQTRSVLVAIGTYVGVHHLIDGVTIGFEIDGRGQRIRIAACIGQIRGPFRAASRNDDAFSAARKDKIAKLMPGILDDAVLRHLVGSARYLLLDEFVKEISRGESVFLDRAQTLNQGIGEDRVPFLAAIGHRLIAAAGHQRPRGRLQHSPEVDVALVPLDNNASVSSEPAGIATVRDDKDMRGVKAADVVGDGTVTDP